ncbi:hypothetical protein J7T55_007721 [Diaporthe amygdali]|uniref:uncharacterized protein n=1 Tax=Phomopsis amygdali TaxID=1214568 RepID=UPI0022FF0523|nr:uncharacterized protein J7T55_007721 [Diaporthe amygdali]KAJ0107532.1 hypothetical protein J7T55_007721 [Diaporthe amygdali]
MSERIEVFHPILAAKLEKDAFEVAGWGVLSAVLFGVLTIWFFAIGDRMPKLPIAMQEEVPNRKKRIDIFIKDTRRLLIDSYKKFQDQVFGITTTEGTNIMIPLELLQGLGSQKSLSFSAFLEEEFSMKKYTKVGNLDEIQISIVNKKLNPTLPQYIPVIQELIRRHWPLEDYDISRISARIFHSAASAENDHWLDIATEHVHSTVVWTENLKKWPAVLRPLVHRFVEGRGYMMQRFEEGKAVVAQTLQEKKENRGKPLNNPQTLLDYLYEGPLGPDDVEAHTIAQINLCVAAIQSMAATVTQCLMDLATHPEYVPELLEEIKTAMEKNGGVVDKRVLTETWKLDSFIKETQRLNPPDLTSFQRKALSDMTLSNGLRIPKGARIVLPTAAINMDREFFQDPENFDGFRYYRLRTATEEARNTNQMVTVGKKDLTWGYGRHACPGRYIAELALKLVVIEFLTRYEIRLPDGVKERPKNIEFEGLVIPDPEWKLTMKSR